MIYQDKSFIELRASAMGACAVSYAQFEPHPLAKILTFAIVSTLKAALIRSLCNMVTHQLTKVTSAFCIITITQINSMG